MFGATLLMEMFEPPTLQPVPPIAWLPMKVHHRHQQDPFDFCSVQYGIGEAVYQRASKASREPGAAFRMGNDAPDRVPNFCDELTAKALGLLFVEPGSGNEFFLGLRVEDGTSHRSDARALRKTAAVGLAFTFPV